MTRVATTPRFKENAHEALARRAAAEGADDVARQLRRPPRRRGRAPAGVRGAARQRARHQEPHARPSRPLSRGLRAQGRRPAAARCIRRATPRRRARSSLDICRRRGAKTVTKGKSMVSEEIGLNDALEAAGIEAGRDRSRRIHHPAPPRDALPHHRARRASHAASRSRQTSAARTRDLPPDRDLSAARAAAGRGARRCCARNSSPPTSASPAPISWSPRPARRSSSPTRATAT